jgi:hypothetical protein
MAKHKTIAYTLLTLALVSLFSIVNAQTFDRKWNLGLFGGVSIYAGDLGNNMMDFTNDVFNQSGSGGISLTRYLNKSFSVFIVSGKIVVNFKNWKSCCYIAQLMGPDTRESITEFTGFYLS